MKPATTCLIGLLGMTLAAQASPPPPPPAALRAVPEGPAIATWQRVANPKKPYVAQLFAPGGNDRGLLDNSPRDHVHHHGLMLALGADGSDFWTEVGVPNVGLQEPVKSTPFPGGDGFCQTLRWISHDGNHLLDEMRTVRVRAAGTGLDAVHWLDWESTIRPAAGRESVKLWGRHYFGLGMRFLPEWSDKGRFLWQNTEGQLNVRGDEKLTPGAWCAATLDSDKSDVTVLMLNHPGNPRPGVWFTMAKPFCYLSASYDLEKNPAVLKQGESWTLRHSIAVIAKPADARELERIAGEWKSGLSNRFPIQTPIDKP